RDRGKKKPLEKVGEWTIIHKRPNKGKIANSNQVFVNILVQESFYPNQGYYVPYPMVRQPVLSSNTLSQLPWSQDPNSAFQASYAEMIKRVENFL
ncbi:hypothetical protein Gotur_031966, partial [Gossypium turneri]